MAELLVLAFIAIVFLRVVVVEPFGVPTGSMAGTLLGNHRHLVCPRCGHRIDIGETSNEWNASCPNCMSRNLDYAGGDDVPGDRVMVNKTAFLFRRPKRWEVAVFWCPSDYSKPYVKRVAGLPGESIQIKDGDVWIDGELARKTLNEARACAIPVWEYDAAPKPEGWVDHLKFEADAHFVLGERAISFDAASGGRTEWCRFQNWSIDNRRVEPLVDLLAYNNPGRHRAGQPVHDFLLEWTLVAKANGGAFFAELDDGEARVNLEVRLLPGETILRLRRGDRLLREARCPPFGDKSHGLAFALVDRRVSVAFDGKEWFPAFDLPVPEKRGAVTSPFRIGCEGLRGTVQNLKLSRDIDYTESGENGVRSPHRLGSRDYFMLGDNSRNSDDSRSWPVPGVPEKNFLGKPFLLHQPSRIAHFTLFGSAYRMQVLDWGRIKWIH